MFPADSSSRQFRSLPMCIATFLERLHVGMCKIQKNSVTAEMSADTHSPGQLSASSIWPSKVLGRPLLHGFPFCSLVSWFVCLPEWVSRYLSALCSTTLLWTPSTRRVTPSRTTRYENFIPALLNLQDVIGIF